jgi:hypothetical protein
MINGTFSIDDDATMSEWLIIDDYIDVSIVEKKSPYFDAELSGYESIMVI